MKDFQGFINNLHYTYKGFTKLNYWLVIIFIQSQVV